MLTRSVRTDIPGRSTPCVDEPASRNSIHAPRRSPVIHLEDQAPLLSGCPDRGGERPAKGGAHALRSNVWGDARKARRVPRQIRTWSLRRKSRCASTDGVDSRRQSGGTSPSVEGLPRQGRGEAGEGRGPRVAQQRVGRRAQSASCPAPDKEKGLPFGSPFALSGGEGDCHRSVQGNPVASQITYICHLVSMTYK